MKIELDLPGPGDSAEEGIRKLRHIAIQSGAQVARLLSMKDMPKEISSLLLCVCVLGLIVPIPEDRWQEIMKEAGTPCSTPGCNCHEMSEALYPVLDKIRKLNQDPKIDDLVEELRRSYEGS